MKKPPKTIRATELSEITGLSDRQHRHLAAAGVIPPPSRGVYEFEPTVQGIFRHLKETLDRRDNSLTAERKRLSAARRAKLQLESEILAAKYIPRAELAEALRNLAANQRAALARILVTDLPARLAGVDRIEARRMMAAAVDEICRTHQREAKNWLATPPR